MSTIEIDRIKVKSHRRPLKPEKVAELKESIEINGLLNPITIDKDYNLIAGLHRLTACTILGFKEIECNIVDYKNTWQSRLAEIDENLIRSELETLERGELWLEREKILEKRGVRAKAGDNQHHRHKQGSVFEPIKTTEQLAKETGYTKRTYQYGKQIASKILPEVKQVIKGTEIAKKTTALLEIARAGSAENKQADAAQKAANKAQKEGDLAEADRQALIVAKARAKQKELQFLALAEIQEPKAKPVRNEVQNKVCSSNNLAVQVDDEWLLGRHIVYCGNTSERQFIDLIPSEVALAIVTSAAEWNHDYLVEKARVVAVVLEEDQICNFCTRQQMPFQFEFLLGKYYIGIFSYHGISKPRKPTEIEGIEGIVSYLINQYTNINVGLFVSAPNLGNGEILLTCERMGRICFGGDPDPKIVDCTISRWQKWTKECAVVEKSTKSDRPIHQIDSNFKSQILTKENYNQSKKSKLAAR